MVIIQIIKTFLFSSSVYSCHLFLISSASVKVFAVSALYTAHTCMKYSLDISSFLEEISSLSHSIVFLYFFAFSLRKPSFISPCYSLELCIPLSIFFPCLLLLYFPQLLVRPLQTTTLPSCISFSLGWFWSLPPGIAALYSYGTWLVIVTGWSLLIGVVVIIEITRGN